MLVLRSTREGTVFTRAAGKKNEWMVGPQEGGPWSVTLMGGGLLGIMFLVQI